MSEQKEKSKIHNTINKVIKGVVILALFVFIVFVLKNKAEFSETVAVGGPDKKVSQIEVTGNDEIVQKFKATSDNIQRFTIMVDRNQSYKRAGSISVNIKDSKGKSVYHVTKDLLDVDGMRTIQPSLKTSKYTSKKWYSLIVNKEIKKGDTYTVTIKANGIKKEHPLYLYTSKAMGKTYQPAVINGKTQKDFHIRMRVWTTRIDVTAIALTVAIAVGLMVLILIPLKIPEKWNKRFSWMLFIVNPWIAFYMVEKVFYNPISIMEPLTFALNVLWYYIVYAVLLMIFNRIKWALMVGNIFFYGAAIANYFVLAFRGNPITPADIYAVGTAMDVADHYVLSYDKPAIIATIILLGLCVIACKLETFKAFTIKKRLIAILITVIVTVASSIQMTKVDNLKENGIEVNLFNQKKGYLKNGYILSFILNVQYTLVSQPDGYSPQAVDKIANNYEVTTGKNKTLKQKPNVVVIMNETFSDLNVVNNIKTNKEVMPFINSLKENTIKGHMFVSVFGGGTSNSEYEFLTGNSVSTLPLNGNAYTQFIKHKVPSLASQLKQEGYDTMAFHPYKAHGWNRDTVYPLLGFDKFIDETSMNPNGEKFRGWYSDSEDYNKIIDVFNKKEAGKPLFFFNVTIQNHGGYYVKDTKFKEEIKIQDEKATDTANRYLSLIHESDRAFEKIVNYFKNQKEPTIVVMFGDHQPKLPDSFYELLYGKSLNSLSLKELQKKYTVPFIIWANYDIDEASDVENVSANYLSSMMLEQTNLKLSRYNEYLLNLRKTIPALNANGYVDKDGKDHEFSENNKYTELINQYQYLQYNSLMDTKHVSNALFSVGNDK